MTTHTPSSTKGHVCLIEDHADLRADLLRLLQASGYAVKDYSSAIEYLQTEPAQFEGVIVSDMVMPEMSGLELQTELVSRGILLPFVFISGESSDRQIISAMKNRAFDFLLKPFTKNELLDVIDRALAFGEQEKESREHKKDLQHRLSLLSPREREVFFLLARGFSNQEIVRDLEISLPTAKQYKAEVMRKLDIQSLSALMALANT
jgi:FixJ family two-component response regulator